MEITAKKSLGQHFLHSKHALEQIVAAARIDPTETILEIGPGTGILTAEILKLSAKVVAVEKDQRAIQVLHEKFSQQIAEQKLELIEGDILETTQIRCDALVANIPYYITGAILEKFLENEPRPKRMVLLVQKEVAERIVAKDGKESLLSVSVKVFSQPKIVAKVAKGAFSPPPKVDSAILSLENINAEQFIEQNIDIKHFFTIVKAGFAHKRKYLLRNLEKVAKIDDLQRVWTELGLENNVRAEDLSPVKWLDVAAKLN